jgi:hypothetical protein
LRLRVGFSGLTKPALRSGLGAFSRSLPQLAFSPRGLSLLPGAFLNRGSVARGGFRAWFRGGGGSIRWGD